MDWGGSITYLAQTKVKNEDVRFGVKDADRLHGICIVGRVGSGRADFLANMALQDAARGMGTIVFDSVGNLAPFLLERLPIEAHERLIVLDPSEGEYPYSWNALDDSRALSPEKAIPLLSETLASLYQIPKGRLTDAAASLMLARQNTTILFLYELLSDIKTRDRVLPAKTDERASFDEILAESPEAVAAATEHGRYLAKDALMRNLLGQKESKFSLAPLEKAGIFVIDFSRIRMFPTRIAPLVRLFANALRAHTNPDAPLALYMQDCLRYLSPEDAEHLLLDPAIAITVSDSSHGEEEKTLREKLLQRAGTVIAFTPHEMDFPLIEHVFYPYVSPEEFDKLEEEEFVIALAIDSVRSRPFFARALPSADRSGASHQDLSLKSRSKYTLPRLKADELFKPQKEPVEGEKGKAEDPGSFSDAFRSIFTKRAGPGGDTQDKNVKPAAGAAPAAGGPKPKPPEAKAPKEPEKKAPKTVSPSAPQIAEIPEEELKKMLHVRKVRAKKKK